MLSPRSKNKRILYASVWLGPSLAAAPQFLSSSECQWLDPGCGAHPGAVGCRTQAQKPGLQLSAVYLLRCTLWNIMISELEIAVIFFFKAGVLMVWEDVAGAATQNLAVLVDQHGSHAYGWKQRNYLYFPQKTPPLSDMLPQVFQQNNKENNSFPLWSHRLSLRVLAWY